MDVQCAEHEVSEKTEGRSRQAQQDASFKRGVEKLNAKNRALVSEVIEQLQPVESLLSGSQVVD